MLQLLGILLVLNTLVSAVWWSVTSRPWSSGLGSLAVAAVLIGLALILSRQLADFVLADAASLHAAQRKAEADARVIATLRERVEKNSAAIDLVAMESTDAKGLLAELREENRKTAEAITAIRKAEGATVSGDLLPKAEAEGKPSAAHLVPENGKAEEKPTVSEQKPPEVGSHLERTLHVNSAASDLAPSLKQHFDKAVALSKEKHYKQAYVAAKECLALYGSMEKAGNGVGGDSAQITADGAAAIYAVVGELAQRVGDHVHAREWAKKAVDLYPSPERKALLATTNLNLHRREEADKIIQESMTQYDPDSIKLRALLTEFGVIKPAVK